MKKEFKKELAALLKKYDAYIYFTCSDSSDTHGLYDDHLGIATNSKETIFESDGWSITERDLLKR